MGIFVEHKKTGRLFILISGGFGMYQSLDGLGRLIEPGTQLKVCVCDRQGDIGWFNSDEIRVINVHGLDVKELKDLGFLEMREKRVKSK